MISTQHSSLRHTFETLSGLPEWAASLLSSPSVKSTEISLLPDERVPLQCDSSGRWVVKSLVGLWCVHGVRVAVGVTGK